MAIRAPDANVWVKTLLIGLVFLFLITSIIDFNAFTSEAENPQYFKDVSYTGTCSILTIKDSASCIEAHGTWTKGLISQVFIYIIVAMAVWLAYTFTMGGGFAEGRFDRRRLVTLVILGVILYFLYTKVLVGLLPELPPIEFAAAHMQTMVGMG